MGKPTRLSDILRTGDIATDYAHGFISGKQLINYINKETAKWLKVIDETMKDQKYARSRICKYAK